ncbi:MAG: RNA polymerase sigma factor [Solirubrobacterales bacterium]
MKPKYELAEIGHDADAFESFYRENIEAVQRFVVRRVGDPHLAADLTSDVFVTAIESASNYRSDRGTPSAWLYGIARIVVASEHRRAGRERGANARLAGRRMLDGSDILRMEERIDAASEARALYAAMRELPESERAVLELVVLDDLNVAQAASALGIKPVTARVRIHRARRALKRRTDAAATNLTPRPMEAP